MYKAIIFDFFDVIRTDAYKTWLNLHNYKLEGEFLAAVQKMDRGEIVIDEFLKILSGITGQTPESIFEEMENGAKVDYEVLELVEKLGRSYIMGLLSNAPSAFLRDLLTKHDLEKHFDEITISSEVGLIKPTPEIFHYILEKMKVLPHESVFIDDNSKNVAAATAIGITGIVYTGVTTLREELTKLKIFLPALR